MTPAIALVLALIGSLAADTSATRQAPSYSAASVVNAASNQPDSFAPNTFISIYGQGLSWVQRALGADDVGTGKLPTVLPGTNVGVSISGYPAHVYYVSPGQINVLIPADLRPGKAEIRVWLDSTYGPAVPITLGKAAPALFLLDAATAIVSRPDGSLVTRENPARPGEVVVLYANGLGATSPAIEFAEIPKKAAPLQDLAAFKILLDGKQVDPAYVFYAGVSPGFSGLYQINVRLPDDLGPNPEIRVVASGIMSPAEIRIPAQP
jgi:uncharacterized protein (TIGR03437 family)